MALTEEEKEAMRAATYEAAIALFDDLAFIRETVEKPRPSRTDVRRISGALRRLLLEDHLTEVAGPRVGALKFPIHDNRAVFGNIPDAEFLTVGFAPMYGMAHGLFNTYHTIPGGEGFLELASEIRPMRAVKCDGLLSDRVARLDGLEISRADILKFVCHHDFGVHFVGKDKDVFRAIRRFRNTLNFSVNGHVLNVNRQDLDRPRPKGTLMDMAHIHAFSTAFFLVRSPDVQNLVSVLEAEIASGEASTEDGPNQS